MSYMPNESNNERRNRIGVERIFRLFDAQNKETTNTMLKFEDDKYHLKITDDSYGCLTVLIRLRVKTGLQDLYSVRFTKNKPKGVVYFFRNAARLNYLYFEESLFDSLRDAAMSAAEGEPK